MKKLLRRIRGAIGMGLAWAFAWFSAGMVLLLIVGPEAADVPFPLGFGLLGFLAGTTFSGVVGLFEGRRRFDQMSLPRFSTWGAVGGLVFAALFVPLSGQGASAFLLLGPIFALAGAGCAGGTLLLARRVEDTPLLEDDVGTGAAGLAESRDRDLLGDGS